MFRGIPESLMSLKQEIARYRSEVLSGRPSLFYHTRDHTIETTEWKRLKEYQLAPVTLGGPWARITNIPSPSDQAPPISNYRDVAEG